MKKIVVATIFFSLLILGCNRKTKIDSHSIQKKENKQQTVFTIVLAKSPVSIPVLMIADSKGLGKNVKINLEMYSSMDKMMSLALSQKYDIFLSASNVAATLYNKKMRIKLMNVFNWGGEYLSTTDPSCHTWSDLKGKKLYVPSKGSIPDLLTQYYLYQNNIKIGKDIEIIYSGHAEIAQLLSTGTIQNAIDVQPFATLNSNTVPNYKIICDFAKSWKSAEKGYSLPGFCIALNTKSINSELLEKFNDCFKQAISWTNENPFEAGKLAEKYLNIDANVIAKAIPKLNFEYKNAIESKSDLLYYYNVLASINSDCIGGKLPDSNFYYGK